MKLFFKKAGNGDPIIILHGLYGSSDNWHGIAKCLASKNTVYSIDQRNHGRSAFSDSHSYNDMRNDLAEFFDSNQIKKATILGHSMGGKTAMWFAAKFPEKIDKLIIADIAPKNYLQTEGKSQVDFHSNILRAMKKIDFGAVKTRKEVDSLLSEKITDIRVRQFLLKNIKTDKATKQYSWRINIDVLINYLNEIISGVNINWFSGTQRKADYPVFFFRGSLSKYISDNDIVHIKQIYHNAHIVDIPDAGHWLHAKQPEIFLEKLRFFLH